MKNNVFAIGLSREEIHTLELLLPVSFQIIRCDPQTDFEADYALEGVVHNAMCIVVNPKAFLPGQLQTLLEEYAYCSHNRHLPLLLFTQSPTREQLQNEVTDRSRIRRINLHARMDHTRTQAVKILRRAAMPSWMGLKSMLGNGFNDGWYLIDLETTGKDPLVDDIIAVRIARMANYEIKGEEIFYIKPRKPVSQEYADMVGLSLEKIENGMPLEQVVEELESLNAPLLFFCENYNSAFLDVAWHLCGKTFEKPYLALDGLAAIAFGHNLMRTEKELQESIEGRMLERSPVSDPYLARLYDLTLTVFEELQNRYDVHAPCHFDKLFGAEILE